MSPFQQRTFLAKNIVNTISKAERKSMKNQLRAETFCLVGNALLGDPLIEQDIRTNPAHWPPK